MATSTPQTKRLSNVNAEAVAMKKQRTRDQVEWFVLDPIFKIFDAVMNFKKDAFRPMLEKLAVSTLWAVSSPVPFARKRTE